MRSFAGMILAAGLAAAVALPGASRGAEAAPFPDEGVLEERIVRGPAAGDLAAYAYRQNPMIRAAREDWKNVVERYRVDTALPDPEVMLEGMYMTETLGERARPDDWTLGVTQAFPWPGKLGKAGELVESDARIARLRLDAAVRDVTSSLRESFEELLYLREAKRVAGAYRELLDQLRKAGEAAYAGNKAALVDVLKAQAQSGQLQYDALLLEELEGVEKARINALLNRAADAPVGSLSAAPPSAVAYDVEEIGKLAEANLEEIRIAREGVGKAEAMLSLARYETLPEFKVGVSFGREDEASQVGVQAGVMIPLWAGKNAGRIGSAKADAEKMKAMQANQVNETRVMVRETWFRLRNSDRLVQLYRDDLLPQAARAMESAGVLFKGGQGSFSDYVETQSAWYNFQLALARAKADYGKYLARLEKLAGRNLTLREEAR